MSRLGWILELAGAGLLGLGGALWVTQGPAVWMEQIVAFCL